jgi:hypothetical protein
MKTFERTFAHRGLPNWTANRICETRIWHGSDPGARPIEIGGIVVVVEALALATGRARASAAAAPANATTGFR